MTAETVVSWIAELYRRNHENALAAVVELDEDALRWRAARSNSIAFNLWHLARWADRLQSALPRMADELERRLGPRSEVWQQEQLAVRWGFPAPSLGRHETGMEIDEEVAGRLPFPPKVELVGYARRAFSGLEEALGSLRDEDLVRPATVEPRFGTVGRWLLSYARHEARHLGMVEAQKGARGLRGTATE